MFDLILKPVINAVRSWMDRQVYQAAQEGAREGLRRLAAEMAAGLELPAPHHPEALPIPMPSAARMTGEEDEAAPALDVPLYERLRELIGAGHSQREAARQLGIPESTARGWLRRAEGGA